MHVRGTLCTDTIGALRLNNLSGSTIEYFQLTLINRFVYTSCLLQPSPHFPQPSWIRPVETLTELKVIPKLRHQLHPDVQTNGNHLPLIVIAIRQNAEGKRITGVGSSPETLEMWILI